LFELPRDLRDVTETAADLIPIGDGRPETTFAAAEMMDESADPGRSCTSLKRLAALAEKLDLFGRPRAGTGQHQLPSIYKGSHLRHEQRGLEPRLLANGRWVHRLHSEVRSLA
jgi:hypothetical protein